MLRHDVLRQLVGRPGRVGDHAGEPAAGGSRRRGPSAREKARQVARGVVGANALVLHGGGGGSQPETAGPEKAPGSIFISTLFCLLF